MNTTYTDIGNVKTTNSQIKKHVTQMTDGEILTLRSRLMGLKLTLTEHSIKRNSIKKKHIRRAVQNFNIVEYNYNHGRDESRVLIRSNIEEVLDDKLSYNLCLVISVPEGKVVTMYWNLSNDSHCTINYSRYSNFAIANYLN